MDAPDVARQPALLGAGGRVHAHHGVARQTGEQASHPLAVGRRAGEYHVVGAARTRGVLPSQRYSLPSTPLLHRGAVDAIQACGRDLPRRRRARLRRRQPHAEALRHAAESNAGQVQPRLIFEPVDTHRAGAAQVGASGDLIRRHHAGPRFDQRPLHGAHPVRQGHEVAPLVAIKHLAAQNDVLRQRAGDLVAHRQRPAPVVHVRLQDVAPAEADLSAPPLAHADRGQRHLVPRRHRRRGKITATQPSVRRAGAYQLGVGVADADRIHPRHHVILAVVGKRYLVGAIPGAEVLEAGALESPGPHPQRQRFGKQHAGNEPRRSASGQYDQLTIRPAYLGDTSAEVGVR